MIYDEDDFIDELGKTIDILRRFETVDDYVENRYRQLHPTEDHHLKLLEDEIKKLSTDRSRLRKEVAKLESQQTVTTVEYSPKYAEFVNMRMQRDFARKEAAFLRKVLTVMEEAGIDPSKYVEKINE